MAPKAPWWPAYGGQRLNVALGRAEGCRRAAQEAQPQRLRLQKSRGGTLPRPGEGQGGGMFCGPRGPEWGTQLGSREVEGTNESLTGWASVTLWIPNAFTQEMRTQSSSFVLGTGGGWGGRGEGEMEGGRETTFLLNLGKRRNFISLIGPFLLSFLVIKLASSHTLTLSPLPCWSTPLITKPSGQ